jgi:hypothetical protein
MQLAQGCASASDLIAAPADDSEAVPMSVASENSNRRRDGGKRIRT